MRNHLGCCTIGFAEQLKCLWLCISEHVQLISWLSYITTKLRTDHHNNQCKVHIMYVANLETKTDLYPPRQLNLYLKNFLLKPKALASLEDFNEVEE